MRTPRELGVTLPSLTALRIPRLVFPSPRLTQMSVTHPISDETYNPNA